MQSKSALMARCLMNRYIKGNPESFLKPIPDGDSKAILGMDTAVNDPTLLLKSPSVRLSGIHYTWLKPVIEEFPEDVRHLLIGPLPKKQSQQLLKAMNIKAVPPKLAPSIKEYINSIVLSKVMTGNHSLPLEFLPSSPLAGLADYSFADIVELCDFLGLHDIGEELRQVVDKKVLASVYKCLTPKEQAYLRQCLSSKEKIVAPTLGLDRWKGDAAKLRQAIQARGLLRLGKALSGAPSDFLCHLAHKLDIGRGRTLLRYYSKEPISGVTPLLVQQTLNLMNILKKKSES